MKLEEIREETAAILGVTASEVDYITDEYLKEMENAEEETFDDDDPELVNVNGVVMSRIGYYCNSIRFGSGSQKGWVFYKRGDKGTRRYGCSQKYNKKWKMQPGYQVRTIGRCPSGITEKFVGRW